MTEQEWLTCENPQRMLEAVRFDERRSRPMLASDRKLRLFACSCCREVWHLLTDERSRKAVEVVERFVDGEAATEELTAAEAAARAAATAVAWNAAEAAAWNAARAAAWNAARAAAWAAARLQQANILRDIIGNPFRPEAVDPQWLTPTVVSLAKAAYEERETEECGQCSGCGWVNTYGPSRVTVHCGKPTQERHDTDYGMMDGYRQRWCSVCWAGFLPEHTGSSTCPNCKGTGRIATGRLDPVRLAVLADALEIEEGCASEPILAHLRSPGQHYLGCWAIDLLKGKE